MMVGESLMRPQAKEESAGTMVFLTQLQLIEQNYNMKILLKSWRPIKRASTKTW
jgi:hypothetical protein